jgi:hypothetical protein
MKPTFQKDVFSLSMLFAFDTNKILVIPYFDVVVICAVLN